VKRCLALALLVAACAAAPKPRILSELDGARSAPAVEQASSLAPQAYAQAELWRTRAQRAWDDGDAAGAQAFGEHALAAYEHAVVAARVVRAEQRLAKAREQARATQAELDQLDEQHKRLAAEADALELRVKVARDTEQRAPSGKGSSEREKARFEAARAILTQAKLVCASARLLDPKLDGLAQQLAKVETLDQALTKGPPVAPIDDAISSRAKCLELLTLARRPALRAQPAAGAADALLAEVSQAGGLYPFRDDRGVVVTLRGLFTAGGTLTPAAREQLGLLGRIAKARPSFPLMVVIHTARGAPTAADDKRAALVADALKQAGAPRVEATAAGGRQPVVDPARPGASERNQRVEIIFVAPA
jgi:flagellar motor protein MotB